MVTPPSFIFLTSSFHSSAGMREKCTSPMTGTTRRPSIIKLLLSHLTSGASEACACADISAAAHPNNIVLQILFIVSLEKVNTCCYRKGATKGGRTTYKILTNNIVHI